MSLSLWKPTRWLLAGALAALGACASRDVPARYPESSPASPDADAPALPAAAAALQPEAAPDASAEAPAHHHHGAQHAH